MTIDEGIELADTMIRLRREVAGIARSVDLASASFTIEWGAALEEIHRRLDQLASYEQQLEPILRPPGHEPFTLEQYRAWLVRAAHPDEDGRPMPAAAPPRSLHPSVH
jgi:hypothetical protein